MTPREWITIAEQYEAEARVIEDKIRKSNKHPSDTEYPVHLSHMHEECLANARAIRERMKPWM